MMTAVAVVSKLDTAGMGMADMESREFQSISRRPKGAEPRIQACAGFNASMLEFDG